MERLTGILTIVLPVVAMLAAGVLVRRRGIVTEDGMAQIKSVIVNICLPAVLFNTFCKMAFTWREAVMFFTMSGATFFSFLLGFLVCKKMHIRQKIAPWLCTTVEGGSIGYALFILLFSEDQLYHLALLDAGNALIQWSVVTSLLIRHTEGKKPLKDTLRSLVTPINVAIISGLIFSITGLGPAMMRTGFGSVVDSVLSFVGQPVGAMIIMSVGFGLTLKNLDLKETGKVVAARAGIFVVIGLIAWLIARALFPADSYYRWAVVIYFILPPTYAYSVYVKDPEEASFLGSYLALYTILTVAAFAVVAAIAV